MKINKRGNCKQEIGSCEFCWGNEWGNLDGLWLDTESVQDG
jgi:hypothetical protein